MIWKKESRLKESGEPSCSILFDQFLCLSTGDESELLSLDDPVGSLNVKVTTGLSGIQVISLPQGYTVFGNRVETFYSDRHRQPPTDVLLGIRTIQSNFFV